MSTSRSTLPLLAAGSLACATLLSACSFEFSAGSLEPAGGAEEPVEVEAAEAEAVEDVIAELVDWAMDLRLTYTSAESAEIGLHGLGVSDEMSEDTTSEFGSDAVRGHDAVCSGTTDLVQVSAPSILSSSETTVSVSADGTGSVQIDQPDNSDHPVWMSATNGPDQHGTWSYSDGVVTLDGVTMHTMADDGWGSLSGTITCTEDTVE